MSERNQVDTFSDFEVMTDRLVQEILYHIDLYSIKPSRIRYMKLFTYFVTFVTIVASSWLGVYK